MSQIFDSNGKTNYYIRDIYIAHIYTDNVLEFTDRLVYKDKKVSNHHKLYKVFNKDNIEHRG